MKVIGFPWTGGKAKLARPLASIIDYSAFEYNLTAFADLCCGGGKVTCAVDPYPFQHRIMNDIEPGVANLYTCLTDKEITKDLMALTDKLVQREDRKDLFDEALTNWKNTEDILLSAAYTLILIYGSRNAGKQKFDIGKFDDYFRKSRVHLKLDVMYNRILKGVKVYNGDVIEMVKQLGDVEGLLVYLDPPYHPQAMARNNQYDSPMSEQQHRELATFLSNHNLKMKFILSGWKNDDYTELLENSNACRRYYLGTINVSSGAQEGKKVKEEDEYIWTNMYIPDRLLPKRVKKKSQDKGSEGSKENPEKKDVEE